MLGPLRPPMTVPLFCLLQCGFLCLWWSAPSAAWALDVEEVVLAAGPARFDGGLTDYFIEISIEGSDLQTASVVPPMGGPAQDIPCVSPESCDLTVDGFDNLADIQSFPGFGNYTVAVNGLAGSDTFTVPFNPGTVDLTGFPAITAPPQLGTAATAFDPITWNCSGTQPLCDAVDAYEVSFGFDGINQVLDETLLMGNMTTSWDHATTAFPTDADLFADVSALDQLAGSGMRQTDGLDDFSYFALYWSINRVTFTPEPAPGLAAALAALAGLAVCRCRR